MKIEIDDEELALITAAIAWRRKTHGLILPCDANWWFYRLKWWISGLMWKEDPETMKRYLRLEGKLVSICNKKWHKK